MNRIAVFSTISSTISKNSQHSDLTELLLRPSAGGEPPDRIRLRIHTDSYKDQGWARVERWNGLAWSEVWSLNPHLMQTDAKLGYKRGDITLADYEADRSALLNHVIDVLR